MSAAKKPAAKRAAENDNELTEKQAEVLAEQAFGEDVVTGSVVVPERDKKAERELREKREHLGALANQGTPETDTHVTNVTIPDDFGDGDGLEVTTEQGRLTLKGEATLDRDGVINLVRVVETARQAVS